MLQVKFWQRRKRERDSPSPQTHRQDSPGPNRSKRASRPLCRRAYPLELVEMNGNQTLYLDQYGNHYFAKTVKELRSKVDGGGSRVSRMFVYKRNGSTAHVGYVIGAHWLSAFQPVERAL